MSDYIDLGRVIDFEPLKTDVLDLFDDDDIVEEFCNRYSSYMFEDFLDMLDANQIKDIKNILKNPKYNETN